MNRITSNIDGGFPLVLDDFRFESVAVRDAVSGLVQAMLLGNHSAILWGCALSDSGSTINVGAGAIAHKGEIYNVEPHSCQKGAAAYAFLVQESEDISGEKVFEDGGVHHTYIKRTAIYINAVNIPEGTAADQVVSYFPRMDDLLRTKLHLVKPTSWVIPSVTENVELYDEFPIQYRKTVNNEVEIRGAIKANGSQTIFVLPEGLRPPAPLTLSGVRGTGSYFTIWIWVNGTVIFACNYSTENVHFSNLKFSLDPIATIGGSTESGTGGQE
jgi:hypothetical protein